MTAEQNAPRPHTSLVMKPLTILHSGPVLEFEVASRAGKPPLEPEPESSAGVETLTGGDQTRKAGSTTGIVSTLVVGSNGGGTGTAEEVAPPADGSTDKSGTQTDPNSLTPAADPNKPATSEAASGAGTAPAATADAPAKTDGTAATGDDAAKTDPATGAQPSADAAKTDGTQTQNADNSKESTSKKKKGLKKLVPW
jgi:hypothetical protein